ncbi:MAG: hypothetical protein HC936_10905 [Leptolyngbyaceae cyanobacterium SU_3_3]|nr:hypothetical protein [Leptolyngbyaceae cyanobacterium SU_3_3]
MRTESRRPAWLGWFYDLQIGRKQMIAMVVCELIPILGLGVGSTVVLVSSLRAQLLSQAKSEVAVTEANYNVKVNQMGFGSRGQSDNPVIVNAAKVSQQGQSLANDAQNQVKQILQNEVKARQIEYATLVSKDLQIIANANKNRVGEKIASGNLANLIKQSIAGGQQIKASEILSKEELSREAPPLSEGASSADALIRYVITPIKDPENQDVIGVLIFGDIVNGKLSIAENTLKAFGTGYSAVYLRYPNGEFALSTSLYKTFLNQQTDPQSRVPLPDTSVLAAAAQAKGKRSRSVLALGANLHHCSQGCPQSNCRTSRRCDSGL